MPFYPSPYAPDLRESTSPWQQALYGGPPIGPSAIMTGPAVAARGLKELVKRGLKGGAKRLAKRARVPRPFSAMSGAEQAVMNQAGLPIPAGVTGRIPLPMPTGPIPAARQAIAGAAGRVARSPRLAPAPGPYSRIPEATRDLWQRPVAQPNYLPTGRETAALGGAAAGAGGLAYLLGRPGEAELPYGGMQPGPSMDMVQQRALDQLTPMYQPAAAQISRPPISGVEAVAGAVPRAPGSPPMSGIGMQQFGGAVASPGMRQQMLPEFMQQTAAAVPPTRSMMAPPAGLAMTEPSPELPPAWTWEGARMRAETGDPMAQRFYERKQRRWNERPRGLPQYMRERMVLAKAQGRPIPSPEQIRAADWLFPRGGGGEPGAPAMGPAVAEAPGGGEGIRGALRARMLGGPEMVPFLSAQEARRGQETVAETGAGAIRYQADQQLAASKAGTDARLKQIANEAKAKLAEATNEKEKISVRAEQTREEAAVKREEITSRTAIAQNADRLARDMGELQFGSEAQTAGLREAMAAAGRSPAEMAAVERGEPLGAAPGSPIAKVPIHLQQRLQELRTIGTPTQVKSYLKGNTNLSDADILEILQLDEPFATLEEPGGGWSKLFPFTSSVLQGMGRGLLPQQPQPVSKLPFGLGSQR